MAWKYTQSISPERITYLSRSVGFDKVIADIRREMVITDYHVEESECFKNCIRHDFILSITPKTFDIFFNSEYGYRGQYFLGMNQGKKANRELICSLKDDLIKYAKKSQCNINISTNQSVENSLSMGSAKIWIHQASSNLNEKQYKSITDLDICNQVWHKFALKVEDDNKKHKSCRHKNYSRRLKAVLGLRAPIGVKLEIKGVFLDVEGNEVIGKGKFSRAKQMRYYGFS